MLIEESYEKRAQQPFSARFSTGDPSTGDLSFWQFLTQKGWTGEGQEKFDIVTKYRQSAGWDFRDGKARLARATETITLTNALPAMQNTVSYGLYDDIESSNFLAEKWETSTLSGGSFLPGGRKTVSGSYRAYSSAKLLSGSYGAVEAAYNDGHSLGGGLGMGAYPLVHVDSTLAATGTWQFVIYTETSAVNVKHIRFGFMGGASGGYVFEASGSNMTTWKLIKSSLSMASASPSASCVSATSGDTVILTCAGVTGGSATAITVKITRDSSGNFEVFEGGVSKGTVTDLTYTAAGALAFSSYLGYNSAAVFGSSSFIDEVYIPGTAANNLGIAGKFLNYDNSLFTAYYTADSAFTFTSIRTASAPSNLPAIVHINAKDIAVWSRDQEPTDSASAATSKNVFLVAVLGTTLRCYKAQTQVFTVSLTIYATAVIPISSTVIVAIGTVSENDGYPAMEVITMNAGAFSAPASQKPCRLDGGGSGTVAGYSALDANGALYFASLDLSAALGTKPSRLFVVTAADLIATKPTISAQYTMTDFTIRGIFSMLGTVYLFGARRRGGNSYASIIKSSGAVVYESTKGIPLTDITATANFYNHGIPSLWRNFDKVLFLSNNNLDLWNPILQMDSSENIVEVASFDSGQYGTAATNCIAVAEWGDSFYLLNAGAGTVKRTTTTRGSLGAAFSTAIVELSSMGANTNLINKTLFSVTIELSAAVPASETLSVLVNDTVVGTMTSADGTRKEIVLTSELTASSFIVKLRWPQASTWTGYISDGPLLKYVPTQFKKRAWGFGIRATKRLKWGDGSHETRAPTTMFTDIEASWSSNIPVTFIDVDGTSYSVVVTDFKQKRPLLQMDRSSEQEAFYFLELLQI